MKMTQYELKILVLSRRQIFQLEGVTDVWKQKLVFCIYRATFQNSLISTL